MLASQCAVDARRPRRRSDFAAAILLNRIPALRQTSIRYPRDLRLGFRRARLQRDAQIHRGLRAERCDLGGRHQQAPPQIGRRRFGRIGVGGHVLRREHELALARGQFDLGAVAVVATDRGPHKHDRGCAAGLPHCSSSQPMRRPPSAPVGLQQHLQRDLRRARLSHPGRLGDPAAVDAEAHRVLRA